MSRQSANKPAPKFKNRRRTDMIIIHCAATRPDKDIGVAEIDLWHKRRGWCGVGYHYVIRRDGTVQIGRPFDAVGAHAHPYNHRSVGVCLVGGLNAAGQPEAVFEQAQWESLRRLIGDLQDRYPDAALLGHRDVNPNKACPCFDVQDWAAKSWAAKSWAVQDLVAKSFAESEVS